MTVIPPIAHADSRLTDADLERMESACRSTLAMWRHPANSPLRQLHIGPESLMALYRVAAHSICMTDDDLRLSELEIRNAIVHRLVNELPK